MRGLENTTFLTMLLISNVFALVLLVISWRLPRLGRLLFFATSQLLISIGMLSKGIIFKITVFGGIIFLLAIAPLGVGSGFPCYLQTQ